MTLLNSNELKYVYRIVQLCSLRMMLIHNNLMRRYEKELKVNVEHVESITTLNVSHFFHTVKQKKLYSITFGNIWHNVNTSCSNHSHFASFIQLKVNELEQKLKESQINVHQLEAQKARKTKCKSSSKLQKGKKAHVMHYLLLKFIVLHVTLKDDTCSHPISCRDNYRLQDQCNVHKIQIQWHLSTWKF